MHLYLYLLYPTAVDGSSDMERSVIDFAPASHRHWTVILFWVFCFSADFRLHVTKTTFYYKNVTNPHPLYSRIM